MRALGAIGGWGVGRWSAAVCRRTVPAAPAGPERHADGCSERVFPWASLTKLCSALAVLVAVEERSVDLDEPAGPPGATVAHLLAHASGYGPDEPRVLAPPGARRIYSNAGFEALADHVARRTHIPFPEYVADAVLRPLGMSRARWETSRSAASGLAGTAHDLAALAAELLEPRLVHPSTLSVATSVAFPGIKGALPGFGLQDPCDWGLGFELRDAKRPHWTGDANSAATFGHFGRSGCFLWIDPVPGIALGVLTDRTFGPWAAAAWPDLADAVLGELAPVGASPLAGPATADITGSSLGRGPGVQGSAGAAPESDG